MPCEGDIMGADQGETIYSLSHVYEHVYPAVLHENALIDVREVFGFV